MLVKKKILPEECNVCSFCSQQAETCDHLLLHCSVAWHVWSDLANDLGLKQLVHQQSFREMYEWWISKSRTVHNRWRKQMIIVSFFAITWSLWTKRNLMVFEHHEFEHHTFCQTVRRRIAVWSNARKEHLSYTTEELVRNFNAIPILFP